MTQIKNFAIKYVYLLNLTKISTYAHDKMIEV